MSKKNESDVHVVTDVPETKTSRLKKFKPSKEKLIKVGAISVAVVGGLTLVNNRLKRDVVSEVEVEVTEESPED